MKKLSTGDNENGDNENQMINTKPLTHTVVVSTYERPFWQYLQTSLSSLNWPISHSLQATFVATHSFPRAHILQAPYSTYKNKRIRRKKR